MRRYFDAYSYPLTFCSCLIILIEWTLRIIIQALKMYHCILRSKMGKYSRKRYRKLVFTTEQLVDNVKRGLEEGHGIRGVTRAFGVAESTLYKRLKMTKTHLTSLIIVPKTQGLQ